MKTSTGTALASMGFIRCPLGAATALMAGEPEQVPIQAHGMSARRPGEAEGARNQKGRAIGARPVTIDGSCARDQAGA